MSQSINYITQMSSQQQKNLYFPYQKMTDIICIAGLEWFSKEQEIGINLNTTCSKKYISAEKSMCKI